METNFTSQDVLERGVIEIIEEKSLRNKLKSGKKLRVKFGIDPTAPNIHLGHSAPLWKLRQFQDLGHKVVLIIGDFTATIGDPSGQNEERKVLGDKKIKENMKGYINQIASILDVKKTEIHYNSEWHKKEGLDAVLGLARTATIQQLMERADFKERIKKGEGITVIELLYPLLQAYDSVKVKADVEIGGTDQTFNLLMGRQVQSRFGQNPQDIITLPLLLGTDGVRKMSKAFNNYIALLDKPAEMFGKIMSISDKEILQYFEVATPLPFGELQKLKKEKIAGKHARDLKVQLAELITQVYWGDKEAKLSREEFETQFQKHDVPESVPQHTTKLKEDIVGLLTETKFASSKTDARRLIDQGGVYINDKRVESYNQEFPKKSFVLRIGRRRVVEIILK